MPRPPARALALPLVAATAALWLGCAEPEQKNNDLPARLDLAVVYDFATGGGDDASAPLGDGAAGIDRGPSLDAARLDMTTPPDLIVADLTACDVICSSPPAPACDRNLVRTFQSPGSCAGGACMYPSTTMTCMYGCYAAQCAAQASFLGNTAAFETGGKQLDLTRTDTVSSAKTVSITTQTYPPGTMKEIHLIYTVDAFKTQGDVAMSFDKLAQNNEQWFGVIPAQPAGTTVTWFIHAISYDGKDFYYSNRGANFSYLSQ